MKILILADSHLSTEWDEKTANDLVEFLKNVGLNYDKIFLLGDIFDFYYEYKYCIPKHFFSVYKVLKELIDNGVKIEYWAGNHDFWQGEFLKKLGIITHSRPKTISIDNKQLFIGHGDYLGETNLLQFILRNEFARAFFSSIHPDIGFGIAKFVSRFSRNSSGKSVPKMNNYIEFAKREFKKAIDLILLGHIHHQFIYRQGKKRLVIVGDWKYHRYYAELKDGRIFLKRVTQSPK